MFRKNNEKKAKDVFMKNSEGSATALERTETKPAESQNSSQKSFQLLSAITCTFCGLLWAALLLSSFWIDLFTIHLGPVFFAVSFFLVMSVVFAVKIQPANQGLSVLFYSVSCVTLLYIGFFVFSLIPILVIFCVQAFLLEIVTAVLGRKEKDAQFSGKKVLRIAAVFLALSVFIFAGESLLYHRRTSELSKATLNGVALTKEQWDCIDEDYILRCGIQNRLIPEGLGVLGYGKPIAIQPDTLNGTLYNQYSFPSYKGLQAEDTTLSVTENHVGVYGVFYTSVRPDDKNLRKFLDTYSVVLGDNYIYKDEVYTSEEILSLAAPDKAYQRYKNQWIDSAEKKTISVGLTIEENGDISVETMYVFPGAYAIER